MIYECDDGAFVISAYQCWIPGAFATKRAAKFAFRLSPDQQQDLCDRVNKDEDRLITWDDVKEAKSL